MNRARLILAGTLALLATLACGLLQTPSPETGEPAEGEQQATATPVTLEAASQESETTAESLATATPVPLPTEPPLISAWPLAADLFYLNDAGQIWRQPLAGDDSAAAAVTRLDLQILDFAVAPGGEWLLYRAGDHVAVTSVDGFSGQVIASELATPSAGDSQPVAWSPDATRLAYATPEGFQVFVPVPGAGSDFAIFDAQEAPLSGLGWSYQADWLLVWRTDGAAALYSVDEALSLRVELGRINGYAWLRDGRLAFAPAEGGLALLQPEDLNSRVFIVPQDRFVTLPVQRPDGTLAFFVHSGNPEEPGFLHTGDPLDFSFRPESNVPVRTEGMIWNPTGTRLLGRGESESATVLIIDPLTGSRATFDAAGVPLRFGWGDPLPLAVEGLRLPADLYFLAPQAGIVQLWRLPASGGPPETVTEAASDVVDYDLSPDGTQIVYTSGGTIFRQIIGSPEGPLEVVTLPGAEPESGGTPAISPSGRRIAYASGGIWIVDLDTGQARRLIADRIPRSEGQEREVEVYTQPRWSPDEEWLLVTVGYYEGSDQALLSTVDAVPRPIPLNLYTTRARWMADGRALIYSPGGVYNEPQLSILEPGVEGEEPSIIRLLSLPVLDAHFRARDGRLVVAGVAGLFPVGPTSVRVYSVQATGGTPQPESDAFVIREPLISPDGTRIAGLRQTHRLPSGVLAGQLVLIDVESGERVMIDGFSNVYGLRWGP